MPVRFKAPDLVLTLGWSVNLQKAQKIKPKNLQVNNSTENASNVLFYGTKTPRRHLGESNPSRALTYSNVAVLKNNMNMF